jgi:hypothetical protein
MSQTLEISILRECKKDSKLFLFLMGESTTLINPKKRKQKKKKDFGCTHN